MKNKLITSLAITAAFSFLNAAEYNISADSQVGFSVKHLKLLTVDGNFGAFSGKADYENNKLNALEGTIEVASVNTKNQKRDEHLRANDIFDAAKYPQMNFKMSEYKNDKILGDLVVKGKTHKVSLDSKINQSGSTLSIEASGIVKRSELGLVWESNLKDSAASDEVVIKLVLKGNK